MKMQFLAASAAAAVAACSFAGTTLQSCDFNSFTNGNLGTSTAGTTAGQGGWYQYGGNNSSYTIVNDPQSGGTRGKSLKMAGAGTAGRDAWTDDVGNNIGNASPSETVFTATFDMYVTNNSSATLYGGEFFDSSFQENLGGVMVQASTGQLYIASYYDNTAAGGTVGNYVFSTGTSGILSRNTWYTFGYSYDSSTGIVTGGYYDTVAGAWNLWTIQGAAAAGTLIQEFDLVGFNLGTSTSNNGSAYFDNILVTAQAPAPGALALLGVAGLAGSRRRR
jgi:MYXO-CTERM domain-containing protein